MENSGLGGPSIDSQVAMVNMVKLTGSPVTGCVEAAGGGKGPILFSL